MFENVWQTCVDSSVSELATRIKKLRGDLTQEEFAVKCKLGTRTIAGLEALDENVRLKTLRQIRKACGLSTEEWLDLLISWLKVHLGIDFYELKIEKVPNPRGKWILHDRTDQDVLRLFNTLEDADKTQVLKTMQRKEVLACLPAINDVWDKLEIESDAPALK